MAASLIMSTEDQKEKARIRAREWRAKNLEYARARELEYRKRNREKACAREKARRLENPEKKKAEDAKYRTLNKETLKEYMARYRAMNRDRIKASQKLRYRNNSEEILRQSREAYAKDKSRKVASNKRSRSKPESRARLSQRRKERKKHDHQYRISCSIRSRLKKCISKGYRSGGTLALLGCSVDELKVYLESRWLPGMSWENYGYRGWHIDHEIPLDSFDLSQADQVAKACHFSNLQPMWWLDNIRKGKSIHIAAAGG